LKPWSYRLCERDDLRYHIEVVNDVLEAVNGLRASSSLSSVLADHLSPSDSGRVGDPDALAQAVKVLREMYQL
jgi:hypothetical protein